MTRGIFLKNQAFFSKIKQILKKSSIFLKIQANFEKIKHFFLKIPLIFPNPNQLPSNHFRSTLTHPHPNSNNKTPKIKPFLLQIRPNLIGSSHNSTKTQ